MKRGIGSLSDTVPSFSINTRAPLSRLYSEWTSDTGDPHRWREREFVLSYYGNAVSVGSSSLVGRKPRGKHKGEKGRELEESLDERLGGRIWLPISFNLLCPSKRSGIYRTSVEIHECLDPRSLFLSVFRWIQPNSTSTYKNHPIPSHRQYRWWMNFFSFITRSRGPSALHQLHFQQLAVVDPRGTARQTDSEIGTCSRVEYTGIRLAVA